MFYTWLKMLLKKIINLNSYFRSLAAKIYWKDRTFSCSINGADYSFCVFKGCCNYSKLGAKSKSGSGRPGREADWQARRKGKTPTQQNLHHSTSLHLPQVPSAGLILQLAQIIHLCSGQLKKQKTLFSPHSKLSVSHIYSYFSPVIISKYQVNK